MRLALRVICNSRITKAVKQRVKELTDHLSISNDLDFSPYWKDDGCDILEVDAKITDPNHSTIEQYIQSISGVKTLSVMCLSDEWEGAYHADLDELHSTKDVAFVVCNIF